MNSCSGRHLEFILEFAKHDGNVDVTIKAMELVFRVTVLQAV